MAPEECNFSHETAIYLPYRQVRLLTTDEPPPKFHVGMTFDISANASWLPSLRFSFVASVVRAVSFFPKAHPQYLCVCGVVFPTKFAEPLRETGRVSVCVRFRVLCCE